MVFYFRIGTCVLAEIKIEMGYCGALLNGVKRIVSPPGQTPLDPKIMITIFVVNVSSSCTFSIVSIVAFSYIIPAVKVNVGTLKHLLSICKNWSCFVTISTLVFKAVDFLKSFAVDVVF